MATKENLIAMTPAPGLKIVIKQMEISSNSNQGESNVLPLFILSLSVTQFSALFTWNDRRFANGDLNIFTWLMP